MDNKNIKTGKAGEQLAKEYLIKSGYKIIEMNWHYSKNAEIDIIAQEKDVTVFTEVKTRKTLTYGHPFEAINPKKLEKLHIAILGYIQEHKIKKYRLDGIAILGLENPKIEHLKNLSLN